MTQKKMLVLAYNKFGYIRFIANKILEYTSIVMNKISRLLFAPI